jgi:hypothetical protein
MAGFKRVLGSEPFEVDGGGSAFGLDGIEEAPAVDGSACLAVGDVAVGAVGDFIG